MSSHEEASVSTRKVVEIALMRFSIDGFDETRLEPIAQESGMSKRMIHYHFGDKRGLYLAALKLAIAQLRPEPQDMELESTVPVEGVRKVVEVIFNQIMAHPHAVRLMVLENLFNYGGLKDSAPLADQSAVLLQMDKLLMLGQDAGAFRPGISALDIYTIITSLCFHRTIYHASFSNLYNMDLLDDVNLAGSRNLAVDTVLAFLTSNLNSQHEISYLQPRSDADEDRSSSVYDLDTDVFSE
ncbi:TetR/AcrR family transcriptional regulator [Corynebacterium epidermidicanis]|uniref:Transcriptional regulator, TetR family n=1 Tax=Corynebacterium epidermidicanis TaxID=1050174 RepID=A0A0G3GY80_9CORY|nr:TetR family transcriptional regulator [Corynebacterium epidermidicanis]AKK03792.1 transcriptional regulator, TetR family [Corynebacterium epidermidicanis]